jgi:VWFA-related protein
MSLSSRTLAVALLSAGALAGMAGSAVAQDKPRSDFGERVDVQEVLLDALVTDRSGKVIVGLGKDDFVVREDGKPVELTGVTFYSSRRLLDSAGELAKKGIDVDRVPQDRYFILFFDDQRDNALEAPRLISQQIEAARRTRQWVETALDPADWVAVVGYDKKLKVYQDWTHDRRALATAVDRAIRGRDSEGNWPSRLPASGPSLLANLPHGNELRDKTTNIYDGLRLLAQASGKVTGRKNMVLFGTGFGRVNTFGQYVPDERYYPGMVRALNTNNVAVYNVDLSPAGTTHTMSDAMNQLSLDTGGRYFFDVVNFGTPLGRVADENGGYYLISYKAEKPAGKAGFEEVQVKTVNPEFKVNARKGYSYGGTS